MGTLTELAVFAANNIHVPFLVSIFLYAWIALGYSMLGQGWISAAWACYAVANIAFMKHALQQNMPS